VRRVLKWFVLLVLLGSSVVFAIYLWTAGKRADADMKALDDRGVETAEEFLQALRDGHLEEAYRLTSADYRKRTSRKKFDELISQHQELLKEPFKDHKFRVDRTAMSAFGKKVSGEYRAWRKTVTGKQEGATLTILHEDGIVKVDGVTFSQ